MKLKAKDILEIVRASDRDVCRMIFKYARLGNKPAIEGKELEDYTGGYLSLERGVEELGRMNFEEVEDYELDWLEYSDNKPASPEEEENQKRLIMSIKYLKDPVPQTAALMKGIDLPYQGYFQFDYYLRQGKNIGYFLERRIAFNDIDEVIEYPVAFHKIPDRCQHLIEAVRAGKAY